MGWGYAIGAAGNLTNMLIDYALGQHTAKKQSTRWRSDQEWLLSNANQFKVRDLRAAGLNPILAVQSGGAMPSAPVTSGQNFDSDFGGETLKTFQAFSAKSQKKLNEEQAKLVKEEEQTQKTVQEQNKANAELAKQEKETQKTVQAQNLANAGKTMAETKLLNAEGDYVEKMAKDSNINPFERKYRGDGFLGSGVSIRSANDYLEQAYDSANNLGKALINIYRRTMNSRNNPGEDSGGRNSAKSIRHEESKEVEEARRASRYWKKMRK